MNYDSYIKDETLLWTMTSNGYKYLTYNLYLSLQKVNPKIKLMIVCVDKESQIFFRTMNISSIFYKSTKPVPPGTQPSQFGSDTFMNYNRMKLEIMEDMRLKTDVNYIIYLDGDIVVFKDFIPYIKEQFTLKETTFLFQCDDLYGSPNKTQCCTGFFAFKRTHLEKSPFVLYDKGLWLTIREDQPWVNKHIRMYNIPFEFLDRSLFPNGVCVNEGRWKLGDPYILHFNHMVGNAKISMMKRLGLWNHIY